MKREGIYNEKSNVFKKLHFGPKFKCKKLKSYILRDADPENSCSRKNHVGSLVGSF